MAEERISPLREAQFVAAFRDATAPAPPALMDGQGQAAGRRFDVYRNNVAVSLRAALHEGFPAVARLLGPDNMNGLAGLFLRSHPPQTPMMMHYGAGFAEFLEAMPALAHLGYLGDVARLELALRESYHAADSAPLAPARLAGLSADGMLQCCLVLAPSLRLLRSRWPVHDIWLRNAPQGDKDDLAKEHQPIRPGPQDVVILRHGFDPLPHLLPAGGADWIEATMAGQTLGEATAAAQDATPHFDPQTDLTALLTLLIGQGAIIDLMEQEPEK